MSVVEAERWTEARLIELLLQRYHHRYGGNGERWARATHVRSHAGFDARRTADFIAMDLWPSKGLALHGHEIKTSRSDWLCELRCPEKADEFFPYMDYWWLVVPDARIVRDDLPESWGLLVATKDGKGLRAAKAAPRREAQPLPRTMLASLLRSVAITANRSVL